ncbi:Glutamine--tRNA ligase-like [Oopsacas minuta]|uniref:Probable glutamine--tRNA ligase n=1 Tax=Oopsacas minuta TaxID=111878 RepID=A0AAV7JY84_9METZ|nr:Glutamine--tRNA ligase-like [Oopsacas minuta]
MAESSSNILKEFFKFSDEKCTETLKNKSLTTTLLQVSEECKAQLASHPIPATAPTLLYQLASKLKGHENHFPFIIKYILNSKIKTDAKFSAAIQYIKSNFRSINPPEFEQFCGIGIEVSVGEVENCVDQLIETNKDVILQRRYRYNKGEMVGKVRAVLKWADGKVIKEVIDSKIEGLLGPKTAEDLAPLSKEAKQTHVNVPKQVTKHEQSYEISGDALNFHKPGENHKTDGYIVTPFTRDLLSQHLKETGGIVITRFPPEPNGILHIGHAKAMNFNFGYAKANGGICYLRFDDTNPEKEEKRFFTQIIEMVAWMGHEPCKITYTSDFFQQLYDWAIELIQTGHAYVDHQKHDEIKGWNLEFSPWRDRPIEESIKLFRDMKAGLLKEGEATLRMKYTMEDGKLDPVAYRIKYQPHPRTGDEWCIYPTYDYSHCLCDSIQNITHSLCTKEFQARRSAYYWLCNALRIYCPVQWEYSRLNLTGTVISKRKFRKLIDEGIIDGMDDPRLFTLTALRRRGVSPDAINAFCAKVGVTQTQTVIEPVMLDACITEVLDVTARRAMAVFDRVKISVTNFPQIEPISVDIPDFPKKDNTTFHKVNFEKEVFIERSDVSDTLLPDYRRLAPGQAVGLRHTGYTISIQEILKDINGAINEVKVTCELVSDTNKPKAWIHWVSNHLECQVRLYEKLFKHSHPEDPKVVPGGYITDCNKNSLKVVTAYIDRSVEEAKVFDEFQFERVGYFCVDSDSSKNKLIFNRTLALKESSSKVY